MSETKNIMNKKPPLVILTGPTAVGKTDLSIALAKKIDGQIISADSMQVYQDMSIGTAKITPEEMDGVRHYLVDEIPPETTFNVVEFQRRAKEAIQDIYRQGKIPIVVGGTGFYIQALLYDIDFAPHEEKEEYREYLTQLGQERGKEYLHDQLVKVDPRYAASVHSNNVKRVIRALEYYHETGEKLSAHNEEERQKVSDYNFAYLVLTHDREVLYDRINRRVDLMMKEGLLTEVTRLKERGLTRDMTSMQAIGYREFVDYFDGKRSLDDTVELIKQDTRHFAKRQLTWFRREKDVIWLSKKDHPKTEDLLEFILGILKERAIIG